MKFVKTMLCRKHRGAALILSMIFILIFSVLAVSIASLANTNVQIAINQQKLNSAFSAAQSGIECGKFLAATVVLPETSYNIVSDTDADNAWLTFCQHIQNTAISGKTVPAPTCFTDQTGSGDQISIPSINFGSETAQFQIRFYRYDSDPRKISLQTTGTDRNATRQINVDLNISKDNTVLNYSIASRGRMWLTGDSTIHGDIFSSWDRPEISPFNITSDSTVEGTINTILTKEQIDDENYQLETLDENNNPIDANGNPLGTNYDERYYSPNDEIQSYHKGINYGQPYQDVPGMDISDYDTDGYENICMGDDGNGEISQSGTIETEYFPHAAGDYSLPRDGTPQNTWNRKLDRHVYENQTFTNVSLPDNRNALFKNCTFDEILYIDCNKSGSSNYNNVRFENCQFNGAIVTDVPTQFKWQHNCLYFTGTATFDNSSNMQEATILAPHFNVNLGNTNPEQNDNNVLTGAVIGGIVDVRGNAQIYGTIISMCDTTQWSSGYVTNIGATLDDGGSETTEQGDIGVISITPDEDKMLPSGITSPIVIISDQSTYSEGI